MASLAAPDHTNAQPVDSLTLQEPDSVFVVPEMQGDRQRFLNWIFWMDVPDSLGSYIHPPDTTSGWNPKTSNTPHAALSNPTASGEYSGTIDRTISFRALRSGTVGSTANLLVRYEIIAEEVWNGTLDAGAGYNPGDPYPIVFRNEDTQATVDYGLRVHFSPGQIDSNGVFVVGMEDFEGFHIWRGIQADGSDLNVIGELSKQEDFAGSDIDSLYFNAIIPALRQNGKFDLPFPVPGLGASIDIRHIHPNGRLRPREFAWFDLNAFNGFTYRYVVTTFDRDYSVQSHAQGLFKFDNCPVEQGQPFPCPSEIVSVTTQVTPQDDMREVYAVPNPYRTGSTQFSALNYHNYPDNKIRFVNVPSNCELRIFTPSGDLVRTLNNVSGTGVMEWDVKNRGGEDVSSGVYIFRVKNLSGGDVYGRVVIIR
jgi:hypothetical protein